MDITLGTKNTKVTDIRFDTMKHFVRCFAFDCSSWRAVLGVDGIFNSFGPERQWKLRFDKDGVNAIHDCEVKMFRDTILFRSAGR